MKRIIALIPIFTALFLSAGCSHQAIQESYWGAGTSVALDEERKGNIQKAETELKVALGRADRELDDEKRASSLHNLGAFYRRHNRISDAIHYLNKALKLEEKTSGSSSERVGRTLAELAAAHAIEGNFFEGRVYADRLKPLAKYYSENEALFVEKVLEAYAIDIKKYEGDVARLKPKADAGNPEAQYELAAVYFDGPHAKDVLPKIISLYENAANQKYTDAQYYLGVMYDKGRGVTNNDKKAREWYRIAAENNHSIAQFNYAVFLMQGRGGPKNEEEAWVWIRKSSAQGYPSAQRALSRYNQ
ncbi:MAG: tetratricopeptide/SEL1-like repeat protein [Desulfobacter sp.]